MVKEFKGGEGKIELTEKSKVLKAKSRVGMVILRVVKEFEGGEGI